MGPRRDDPLHVAEGPDDDDRRDPRSSESGGRGEDRDRAERLPEQDEGPDAEGPDTRAETLDRAEERAASADASLRERLQAGAQRTGEAAATSAAALLVSAASILGWQKTDDKLPEAVRTAATAAETVEEVASDVKERKNREEAAEEPNRVVDPQEQPPPDREGDRAAGGSAEGLHRDAPDDE
ncbi:hypothetical protein [Micromonospora purpureochromogenes]|uniref:Sec-independent protein translocase protein TatA n=1 Tax=Micromonospora purpureochromogenes TaxID=47872 RepID=A0ABX2RRZ5_9ACTN|nr:hypothetical protein [Micromonospora purpureochromogenes]NYF59151.1 Sec-independent protein translocase protein TatA [Micromonospora purpureochromogenes]